MLIRFKSVARSLQLLLDTTCILKHQTQSTPNKYFSLHTHVTCLGNSAACLLIFCFNCHFFQRRLQSKTLLLKIKTERFLRVNVNNNAETLA